MNKIVTLFIFLTSGLLSQYSFAQASCATAVTVTDLTGASCATASPSGVNTINTGCGDGTFDTWFVFTAQGPSATISVTSNISRWNPEFAVIASSDNTCTGSLLLEGCADQNGNYTAISGTINGLTAGDTYWIVVTSNSDNTTGTITTCVTNAAASPCADNDDCLTAQAITLNATGGGATCVTDCNNGAAAGPDFAGTNCFDLPNETVWYEFTTDATASTFDINLTSATLTQPEFSLFTTADCINFLVINCTEGSGGTASASGVSISPNTTYILAVSDVGGLEGNFNLCITQNAAVASCVDNQNCSGAAVLPLNPSGTAGACVTDCNTGATPGPIFTGPPACYNLPNETVWYQITTAADVEFLNIELNSTDMSNPEFTVFTNSCGPFSIVDCVEGAGGSAQASVFVAANTTYLIAVSDATGDEGNFELCVTQFANTASCNTSNTLAVTATSLGSSLTGPFLPGEVVTFCYTINAYQSSTSNCNYLHGIVPSFGDCWTPTSFNAQGMPNVTVPLVTRGVLSFPPGPRPACHGNSAGTWSWYQAGTVDYNLNTPNPLGLTTGDDVGAGWFFVTSYNSFTTENGPGFSCTNTFLNPNDNYGDNSFPTCSNLGGWQVCFQLTANSLIDCQAGLSDCSVQMKTFADGEIGVWQNLGCLADLPTIFNTTLDCQILLQQGLEKIKGYTENGKNFIEWEISSEANNLISKYVVERSRDGINWYHLKDVESITNTDMYELTDYYPFKNVTYYRVKLLEGNGTEYLTQTIAVTNVLNSGDGIVSEVFPNPANSEMSMLYTGESLSDPLNIQIHNPMGQFVDEQIINLSNINQKITINTDKLVDGVYYISITQNNVRTLKKISISK